MSDNLAIAHSLLKVKSILVRRIEVRIDDDTEPFELKKRELEAESYRGVEKVKEIEIGDEGHKSWEYGFHYAVGLRFVNDSLPDDEKVKLVIEATFNATYESAEKLTDDVIAAFSEENVGYHVWPYWRELVQSTCSRMDIPHIKVGLYHCLNRVVVDSDKK